MRNNNPEFWGVKGKPRLSMASCKLPKCVIETGGYDLEVEG